MLQTKLAMTLSKLKDAQREIKRLKGIPAGEDDSDDDGLQDEIDLLDFMIPYAVRVLAAPGKKRFQLLMEESKYLQKRMEYRRGEARKKFLQELENSPQQWIVAFAKRAVSDAISFLSGASGALRGLEHRPSQGVVTMTTSKPSNTGSQKALPSTAAHQQQVRPKVEQSAEYKEPVPHPSLFAAQEKTPEVANSPSPRPRSRSPERGGVQLQSKEQATPVMR